ncbi:uncharacterized protein F4812DRAFT_466156 [Daldinia caldariorum]|uniref:uncharacterized protein n=1 Tax=Daldinia caldariorum TaxID=326644 RepID=UPI0020083AEE|nr:uncharacterized protein F4812DRAFT_466156 [Daldinia caldariorum]KAI1465696.1 hypothetical protein F4812DRAFT_466156 [Daldinia caldariorum]
MKNGTTTKKATILSDDELNEDNQFDDDDDDDDEVQEGGGLSVDELEDLFDDDAPSTSSAPKIAKAPRNMPSSSNHSAPGPNPSRTSGLSSLAKMKMGLSWKNKPMKVVPVTTPTQNPSSKPTASSPPPRKATAASPPLKPSAPSKAPSSYPPPPPATGSASGSSGADATKPKPKPPILGQKRKEPPSIFMKPKPKSRRMS